MSRLSEILGVQEGQKFRYAETDMIYKVEEEYVYYKKCEIWTILIGTGIYLMIENPDKIYPICKLTDQQITAIKGRIAEGTPWAARDKGDKRMFFYDNKPKPNLLHDGRCFYADNQDTCCCSADNNFYDFITFENSPVYLPELIEGSEQD